jgi:hypothetical protein
LFSHGKPVVGAMIHRRYPPFAPLLYRGELGHYRYVPEHEMFSGQLVPVDATGCGCISYESDVFNAVERPWYELYHGENGKAVGEDIRLCSKLRSAGIEIYVDTSVCVDHITTFNINREFFKVYKNLTIGHPQPGNAAKKETKNEL